MPCHSWEETQPGSCIEGRAEARGLEPDQWFTAKLLGKMMYRRIHYSFQRHWYLLHEGICDGEVGEMKEWSGTWRCDSYEGWQRSCGWEGNRSSPRVIEEMFVCFVGVKIYFLFSLGGGYMEGLGNDWITVHTVKSPKNGLKNIMLKKKRGQGWQ